MKLNTKRWMSFGIVSSTALFAAAQVNASGFALQEQNASGLGNAYAGSAAVAEDASTVYFNAAGLTQLDKASVVVSGNLINLNSKFQNSGSNAALAQPLGGDGGNAGGSTLIPALYASLPIGSRLALGLGINAPFGLKTEYEDGWMGRFQATKSEVKTININPALAFEVSDVVSLSVGIDYQKLDAELNSMVNYDAVVAQGLAAQNVPPATINTLLGANPGLQGPSSVKGDDSKWGYDLGILIKPNSDTKIGLSYRSAINYHVTGNATFGAPTSSNATVQAVISGARATALADGPIMLDIKLPASARLALAQQFSERAELLVEASWTQWSSVQALTIVRSSGTVLKNTPENWSNTWRYAVGGNFKLCDTFKLRTGLAFDKSPVSDANRTARLPDADRTWVSVGGQWQISSAFALDVGYAHLFAKDASIRQSDGYSAAQGYPNGNLVGAQKASINLFGVQASVKF